MNYIPQPVRPAEEASQRRLVGEQRLILYNVEWKDYLAIGEALLGHPSLRLTYDRGSLEFMTTSPEHEKFKKRLGRLIEALAEEFNLPVDTAGNMTFRRQAVERGMEPDDCFWIANEPRVRARMEWDPDVDPPPDLVLEIEISCNILKRLPVLAALGVPEVWRFDGETLTVHQLQADSTYAPSETSPTFPGVPVAGLVPFALPSESADFPSRVRAFRAWVREQRARG
jgi:Uma2 family endonuclease